MTLSNKIETLRTRMGMKPFASGIFGGFKSPMHIFWTFLSFLNTRPSDLCLPATKMKNIRHNLLATKSCNFVVILLSLKNNV